MTIKPVAWALVAHGVNQKVVVREDVANESLPRWREYDPAASAVALYSAADLLPVLREARDVLFPVRGLLHPKRAALIARLDATIRSMENGNG